MIVGRDLLYVVLVVLLVLVLVGAFPTWPHSATWGYGPSSVVGLVLVVLLLLMLMGRL